MSKRLVIGYCIVLLGGAFAFDDYCPNAQSSIGACLHGLCPFESVCINDFCCSQSVSLLTSASNPTSIDEHSAAAICSDTIGLCLYGRLCPFGYQCKAKHCCPANSIVSAASIGCSSGYSIGDCLHGLCPHTHVCIDNVCCSIPTTSVMPCHDRISTCKKYLCNRFELDEFVRRNCAFTCDKCRPKVICRNSRNDCDLWARQGFCNSHLYTTSQKQRYCAMSCNLCTH